jgi:DNA-binding response OmpR family regulator
MPRMLLVEDEPAALFALRKFFSSDGFAVDCAQTLPTARALISATLYDIVIADLRLSGSDGVEGVEILRMIQQRSGDTPVIILTAYAAPDVRATALHLGAKAFLQKPAPLPEIAAEVRRLVSAVTA